MSRSAFYESIRTSLFDGHMSQGQVDGIERLINAWCNYCLDDPTDDLAYNLATSYHETAQRMQPITEFGSKNYFKKYDPGTRIGKILGNTQPGDGYRFRGMGDVMNTGRANAEKATEELNKQFRLGVDLVANPDQRKDPLVSALSLFIGNKQGWWTGKSLSDYIGTNPSSVLQEFIEARHVVNGTDKAQQIAEYAMKFRAGIAAAGGIKGLLPEKPAVAVPAHTAVPVPGAQPAPKPAVAVPATIASLVAALVLVIAHYLGVK